MLALCRLFFLLKLQFCHFKIKSNSRFKIKVHNANASHFYFIFFKCFINSNPQEQEVLHIHIIILTLAPRENKKKTKEKRKKKGRTLLKYQCIQSIQSIMFSALFLVLVCIKRFTYNLKSFIKCEKSQCQYLNN